MAAESVLTLLLQMEMVYSVPRGQSDSCSCITDVHVQVVCVLLVQVKLGGALGEVVVQYKRLWT